ncbi:MAG TPA: hypothetical protein VJ652_00270 [Noviherbaspirillum sp.]|nr:hypothetical protein [Noviherbaspirillum sp.]
MAIPYVCVVSSAVRRLLSPQLGESPRWRAMPAAPERRRYVLDVAEPVGARTRRRVHGPSIGVTSIQFLDLEQIISYVQMHGAGGKAGSGA